VWKCAKCRKQFSVTTGTIFHGSKVPLQTWLFVFFEMCANKNGLAAREVERRYGVAPKTAWFMTQRIREAMANRAPGAMIGTIVADEPWIGGDPNLMNAERRASLPKSNAWYRKSDKQPVIALIDTTTGEARSKVVTDVKAKTLRKVIVEQVEMAQSELHTDESKSYTTIGTEFAAHRTVNHASGEYLGPGGASTNQAENYFSQLKRSLDGTHHNVSRVHLQRYLNEFDFRYSTCKQTDTERVHRLMGQTGRRVTYKRVVG
jgi:transposase-like protein